MNEHERMPVHDFGRCVTEQPVLTHSSSGGHNDNFRFTFPSRFQELKSSGGQESYLLLEANCVQELKTSGGRDKLVLSEASFVHDGGGRNTFLLL